MSSKYDVHKLQTDLDALLNKWSEAWQMPFNGDKSRVMHIGAANQEFIFHNRCTQLQNTGVEGAWGAH